MQTLSVSIGDDQTIPLLTFTWNGGSVPSTNHLNTRAPIIVMLMRVMRVDGITVHLVLTNFIQREQGTKNENVV
ncbi:hypothetical protein [Bartonella grahamii]|uniref:hypothetical protein n=1 Tax=Bartonella grahamii TaxID=33045 RepID=UPI000309398E|nr:hypothetical protein [Bartonella grahamii]